MLTSANRALRSNNPTQAIRHYLHALRTMPELGHIITPSLILARKRHRTNRQQAHVHGERLDIAICLGPTAPEHLMGTAQNLVHRYQSFSQIEIIRLSYENIIGRADETIRTSSGVSIHALDARNLEQFVIDHPYDAIHLLDQDTLSLVLASLAKLIWGTAVLAQGYGGTSGADYADAEREDDLDIHRFLEIVRNSSSKRFELPLGLPGTLTGSAELEMYARLAEDIKTRPSLHVSPASVNNKSIKQKVTQEQTRPPTVVFPIPDKKIPIAFFWKQNDTTIYGRRHDMVIKYLASRQDISKVLAFDLPITFNTLAWLNQDSNQTEYRLAHERTLLKMRKELDTDEIAYRVFVHDESPIFFEKYCTFIQESFREFKLNPHDAIFWFYPFIDHGPKVTDYFTPHCVVTDIVDDQRAWPDCTEVDKARYSRNYQEMLSRSTFSFCNCLPVKMSMKPMFPSIRLVPNACDPDPPAYPVDHPLHAQLVRKDRPIFGFTGNLEEKMDIPLLEKIAVSFPRVDILLIGSTHTNPDILALNRYENIHFPGVVPYEQAGTWISLFDAAMIPHLNMELTQNMNPLKLYSYLAWKVPVVCTNIPNIDKTSGMVFSASSHDEFITHLKSILENKADRLDIGFWLKKNSWQSRFETHVDEIVSSVRETLTENHHSVRHGQRFKKKM